MENIGFDDEALGGLKRGMNRAADATVRAKLGHSGLGSVFQGPLRLSRLESITDWLGNAYEHLGEDLIRVAAESTDEIAGDGAATAAVLTQALVLEGLQVVASGADAEAVRNGIKKAAEALTSQLAIQATEVTTRQQMASIASHDAADAQVGELIADAIVKVGDDGIIVIEESEPSDSKLEFTNGVRFGAGYVSPEAEPARRRREIVLNDPYVLINQGTISSVRNLAPLLAKVTRSGRPLLIIAGDIRGEALSVLASDNAVGGTRSATVRAPGSGDRRKALLEDVAALTGATVFSGRTGPRIATAHLGLLGRARKAIVTETDTTIVGGAGGKRQIDRRIRQIRAELLEASGSARRTPLERLGRLTGVAAVLKADVSGEHGAGERRRRFEDAIRNVQAAAARGIVAGHGVALLQASTAFDQLDVQGDEAVGVAIVRRALNMPARYIAANAGLNGADVVRRIRGFPVDFGLDPGTGQYVNLVSAGIVDPVDVTRTAIFSATEVAGRVLSGEPAADVLRPVVPPRTLALSGLRPGPELARTLNAPSWPAPERSGFEGDAASTEPPWQGGMSAEAGGGGGETSEPPNDPVPSHVPPIRQVNAFVTAAGDEDVVRGRPLTPCSRYEVMCNIGPADPRSLLTGDDATFPRDLLPHPGEALTLTAVLHVEGVEGVVEKSFELPAGTAASEWVRLALPVAESTGTLHAKLAIYYQVVVVHLQRIDLPVGGPASRGGPTSHLLYRLSRSFDDLGKLKDRSASIVVAGGLTSSAVLINGLTFARSAFETTPRAADNAVIYARKQLYDIHFRVVKDREISRYALRGKGGIQRHGKSIGEFTRDLAALAKSGRTVYVSIFRGNVIADSLPSLLRTETEARKQVPVIQAVDLSGGQTIPWALIYDLPLGGNVDEYKPCRSIEDFGPGGDARSVPLRCPYESDHRDNGGWKSNQLCPWGFWGLSTVIEHPPLVDDRKLETTVTAHSTEMAFLIAADTTLDAAMCKQHLADLRRHVQVGFSPMRFDTVGVIGEELAHENMDLVYLYCHTGYGDERTAAESEPFINLGNVRITPLDIDMWARSGPWPDPHWPTRHPFVVINGCHTAENLTGTLTNFVTQFTNTAGASGVLGTEITMEQGAAGWAMELFLAELSQGASVGMALLRTRWSMLRRGNLLGLAYTPYCLAGLSLRERLQEVA